MITLATDKFTVHGDINRDVEEWAAQNAIAERATARTVAEMIAAQQRREAEETANSVRSIGEGWAE